MKVVQTELLTVEKLVLKMVVLKADMWENLWVVVMASMMGWMKVEKKVHLKVDL